MRKVKGKKSKPVRIKKPKATGFFDILHSFKSIGRDFHHGGKGDFPAGKFKSKWVKYNALRGAHERAMRKWAAKNKEEYLTHITRNSVFLVDDMEELFGGSDKLHDFHKKNGLHAAILFHCAAHLQSISHIMGVRARSIDFLRDPADVPRLHKNFKKYRNTINRIRRQKPQAFRKFLELSNQTAKEFSAFMKEVSKDAQDAAGDAKSPFANI